MIEAKKQELSQQLAEFHDSEDENSLDGMFKGLWNQQNWPQSNLSLTYFVINTF